MATPDSDGFVRSFARGLSVIEAMGAAGGGSVGSGLHTVASIAAATELPRTVARRILLTLTELGFVVSDGKSFRLTPKILNLGLTYLTSLPFWNLAQEVLERLCAEVDESVALSVFDGRDIVYILRVPSRKVLSLRLGVGSRLPAYVTSPGRVLLAGQDDLSVQRYLASVEPKAYTRKTLTSTVALRAAIDTVREKGYAWVDGELDPSVCGLSVPVRDEQRKVIVALNVNLLSGDTTEAKAVKKLLMPLVKASERLSATAPSFLSSVVRTVGGNSTTTPLASGYSRALPIGRP